MSRDVAAALVAAVALAPRAAVHTGREVCLVRRVTGLPCPTCGLTRSWHAAARANLGESMRWHPLGAVTLAGALAYAAGARPPTPAIRAALATAWVATWLVRLSSAERARRARRTA